MLQYRVNIDGNEYIFDDSEEALGFAKMARLHFMGKIDINITVVVEWATLPFSEPGRSEEDDT